MRTLISVASLVLALPAGAGAQARARPQQAAEPTLVVFLTVDQLRTDYLEKWQGQFTGGLARMMRGGAVFLSGFQDHAITETAPGHSTTLSGRHPASTGIVSNATGVGDRQSPMLAQGGGSVHDSSAGASPYRFRGTTLMDWLRFRDPVSRGLSVSRKDRGAILPLGRTNQEVYWYAPTGHFTTSTWYRDRLPEWVTQFNAREVPRALSQKRWDLLLAATEYPERDSVPEERAGRNFTFPYALPDDPAEAARALPAMPWMDDLILRMGLEGLQVLSLGRGPHADVLALSLSTMDAIGHSFGPDSREVHDGMLRLDRYLGTFIDSLYKLRDSTTVVIALTSDHGVTSYPRLSAARTRSAPVYVNADSVVKLVSDSIARLGVSRGLSFDDGMIFVNRGAFAGSSVRPDEVLQVLARRLRALGGVQRVELRSSLAQRDTSTDYVARRWLHMIPPELPVEMVLTLVPNAYWAGVTYATHGQPHDTDAQVPVLFYGPWFATGNFRERVGVVDMAPTLARVLGVTPAERLDGRVLTRALRRPRQ